MKIKSMKIKNFGNISEFSTNLGNGINFVIGSNGAGKSTVGISAIWACLQGIAEKNNNGAEVFKGKRGMWVGRYGDDAEITLILTDPEGVEYVVTRKISENKLEIKSSDGRTLNQGWIDSFWNSLMLSPVAFSKLTPREQAECMGIDTSEFDEKLEELKTEAQGLRAVIKDFGDVTIPEKAERVDISELNRQKNEALAFNRQQWNKELEMKEKVNAVNDLDRQIAELNARLQVAMVSRENRINEIAKMTPILPLKDVSGFDKVMEELDKQNAQAALYEQALERAHKKDVKLSELSENIDKQNSLVAKKVEYMQNLDLPFANLTIDEKGGLLLDGRPIKEPEFSTAECIKISTLLLASRAPEWKYVFLPGFDLFDDIKSKEVLDFMLERDFQVLAEKVVSGQSDVLILQDSLAS